MRNKNICTENVTVKRQVGRREGESLRMVSFAALPMEVLMYVFRWVVSSDLDLRSLEQLSQVCRGFYICARYLLFFFFYLSNSGCGGNHEKATSELGKNIFTPDI